MFDYNEYGQIIKAVKESGKQCNFIEAVGRSEYVIIRHDVEFSVERAYQLACLEKENDFYSTYFFQVSNNSYNLLSKKNIDMLEKIFNMGHKIGLHFHLNGRTDVNEITDAIQMEMDIMNRVFMFGQKITEFSIHRPTVQVLKANIKLPGLLNAYQDDFFSFVENIEKEETKVKYMSDARHHWNYHLYPDSETIAKYDKVQILTHPYSWTKTGGGNLENFRTLIREKNREFIETIDSECKHFGEIKDEL